jgi:hypothetical protein
MMLGMCQNMLKPRWIWCDEYSASAFFLLATLIMPCRLWSLRGYCLSGGT